MSRYELAQLNIAVAVAPLDSPVMADFMANLARINALADAAPGFVWRLQTEEGDATSLRPLGDDVLVNMSVWTDADSLRAFVYRSAHVDFLRRRAEWFHQLKEVVVVLWWVPRGHRPSLSEAVARLERLRAEGPSEQAFTFRQMYPPPDAAPSSVQDRNPASRRAESV